MGSPAPAAWSHQPSGIPNDGDIAYEPMRDRSDTYTSDAPGRGRSDTFSDEPPRYYDPSGTQSPPLANDHSRHVSQPTPFHENDFLLSDRSGAPTVEHKGPPPPFFRRGVLFFTATRKRVFTRLLPLILLLVGILAIAIGVPIALSQKGDSNPSDNNDNNNDDGTPIAVAANLLSTPVGSPDADDYDNTPRLIFAHYMLITPPPDHNYNPDIAAAQAAGIDAFAINYGGVNINPTTLQAELRNFYDACADHGFSAFISIDATSTTASGDQIKPEEAADLFNMFAGHPAQLKYRDAALFSSFQTTDTPWNWRDDVLTNLNTSVHLLPGTLTTDGDAAFNRSEADGAAGYFSWIHHFEDPHSEASIDASFAAIRNSTEHSPSGGTKDGKLKWMAPLAPWFYKNLGAHWATHQGPQMFLPRALDLLRRKPDYLQLVTWNDYGESTYFGPVNSNLTALCSGCYYGHLDHSGFLEMLKPIFRAYRKGDVDVTFDADDNDKENVWMYYRPHRAATGTVGTRPDAWDILQDKVYIVTFVAEDDTMITLTAKDGAGTKVKEQKMKVMKGLTVVQADWAKGNQTIMATRGEKTVVKAKTGPSIMDAPDRNGYNGNVVVV
ncbi:hypothetical protein P152DRAFT_335968 [Eremomyces bilateralis CBS 781.70]|uniref:Glycoside hydrolase n=1 Tax=Eremomyces bilateralis CBS 781.70 TaxID=1392243 RepID=A0A6G1G4L2_9PEZI|nr:uncharacterized protein P152DRAFT_335968 [Eremomyces bilateralis CBS 781.70]KAF1813025.1 hypothetical protein P152DRAFT_335968 [Eremomyces bilateralis CBS 781.70]